MGKLIDISRPVSERTLLHPGDPRFMASRYKDLDRGDDYTLSLVTLGIHTGTHFDFPRHFIAGGRGPEDYPPEHFVRPAHVIDCGDSPAVLPEHLAQAQISDGDAVLFRTRNAGAAQDQMRPGWVYVAEATARRCVELGCSIVGADYIEVERGTDAGSYPVHETLLGSGILLLENIDLRQAGPGCYRLHCLPILIPGLEAAPCRAILEEL